MKALILSNHFSPYSGASIVALEVAQYLESLGYEILLCAGYIASPLLETIKEKNIAFTTLDQPPDPNNFDVIWSQNHILSALFYKLNINLFKKTKIYVVSLSPYDLLELPGASVELATKVLANSQETADALIAHGISANKIKVFHNAAPPIFDRSRHYSPTLKKILAVANHAPVELEQALSILEKQNISVTRIGFWGEQKLLTPELIADHDGVVTIGKSVQYALLGATPVYIYDRFGGPGWLIEENFKKAAYYNFSGRCSKRILEPDLIAKEIVEGYCEGLSHIKALKTQYSNKFRLDIQLDNILNDNSSTDFFTKLSNKIFHKKIIKLIKREGSLALHASHNYADLQRHMIEVDRLRKQINQ